MRILVVSATKEEISGLSTGYDVRGTKGDALPTADYPLPTLLVTGVGMVNTALQMGKLLATEKFDLAINIGLAGSFFKDVRVGSVVNVISDCFAELGAEDGDEFLTMDAIGLGKCDQIPAFPFTNPVIEKLPRVTGITVNTVHGNEASIDKVFHRLHPFVESMEGAAFFQACNAFELPCVQLRAISNRVERRNRKLWDIEGAIKALHLKTNEIITSLS